MHSPLAQIIFHIAHKAHGLDVVAPIFPQVRLRFFVDRAHQPELRVFQIQPMPGFEKMMNPFALDQRAGKNGAKDRRAHPWLETFHVYAARQVE